MQVNLGKFGETNTQLYFSLLGNLLNIIPLDMCMDTHGGTHTQTHIETDVHVHWCYLHNFVLTSAFKYVFILESESRGHRVFFCHITQCRQRRWAWATGLCCTWSSHCMILFERFTEKYRYLCGASTVLFNPSLYRTEDPSETSQTQDK